MLGPLVRVGRLDVFAQRNFREGYAQLGEFNLSFDAWLLEPQLPELVDLARAFPDTSVILDHVGTPLGLASYQGKREERFPIWRDNIAKLAAFPMCTVKLGGLAMAFCQFPVFFAVARRALLADCRRMEAVHRNLHRTIRRAALHV